MGTGTAQLVAPGDCALHGGAGQRRGARTDEGFARGITTPLPLFPSEKEIVTESSQKLKFSAYPML